MVMVRAPYLLYSTNQDRKTSADDKFKKAKKCRPVDVNDEVYNRFHYGERKDQSLPCAIHCIINCVDNLLVGSNGHVSRKTSCRCGRLFCSQAAR